MIDGVDLVLRETLATALPGLASKIGFQRPDEDWKQRIGDNPGVWLNCYLADLREDRHHRANDRWITADDAGRWQHQAPFLLRCEYLLTAWNTAKDGAGVAATEAEHRVLGQVLEALVEAIPLTPAEVLTPAELATLPPETRDASFDTMIAPPDGYLKLAEFWGTMGRPAPLRPAIPVVLTVPVPSRPMVATGVVETIITNSGAGNSALDTLLTVGGQVLDTTGAHAADPVPVAGARISVLVGGALLTKATSESDGRFVLDGLVPGQYSVQVRAPGLPPAAAVIELPAAAGSVLELRFV